MKIQSILIFIGVALLMTLGVAKTIQHFKGGEKEIRIKIKKPQWGLCWEDEEEKRCGIVKKIRFHDKQIIKMEVYFPSTRVTVDFFRDPGKNEIGIYLQKGERGKWILDLVSPKKYKGRISNDKGWNATLVVEKLICVD